MREMRLLIVFGSGFTSWGRGWQKTTRKENKRSKVSSPGQRLRLSAFFFGCIFVMQDFWELMSKKRYDDKQKTAPALIDGARAVLLFEESTCMILPFAF